MPTKCVDSGPTDLCLEKFEQILDKLEMVHEAQQATDRRLFYDNGAECIQTKVNNNSKTNKLLMWIFGVITTLQLTLTGWLIITNLRG